jgi:GR25 family glycosyltransferase involved in LPS biosynthesis
MHFEDSHAISEKGVKMITRQYPQNPFALLRISTQASAQEVVEHSKELIEDTYDNELKNVYSKAVENIIHHPFMRLVNAVWEMPDTDYAGHDETWRKFNQAFQSNPAILNNLNELADTFVRENFYPDKLLVLLSPLLEVSQPAKKQALILDPLATDTLRHPLASSELF